jgi:hypothetical protein
MMDHSDADNKPLITYEQTARGYHLFTFYESSKRTLDQWLELAKPLMASMKGKPILRQIYDMRKSGLPPMAYAGEKGKDLMALYPDPIPFRLAVVVNAGGFFGSLIKNLMNMLGAHQGNQIRIFGTDKFAEAEEWVMQDTVETENREANGISR